MTTKVTLSSPPVQHQLLHDQPPVDGHHQQHEQQQHDHHYGQSEEALSDYGGKRPPTPPKTKQQTPSWKQHCLSSKPKDVNTINGYYPDSGDPSQIPTTTPNTNNQKKTTTTSKASSAYDYDHQQYLYHQQALKAESNKKGHVQQPPPSLKKHKDQLTELFMVQEQLDQASRERDRFLEENTHLRYQLQALHYRMRNVEYMWQSYNAAAAAQMWEDSNKSRQQRQPQQYPYPYDPFGPPAPSLDFISLSNRSLPDQQRPPKSQHSEDGFRGRQRFRRYRSKSLPRNTSFTDTNDTPYSLHQSMTMMPPAPMFSSMMTKPPIAPPPPQMFDRPPPPQFGPRMHNDPLLDTNNSTMGDDDDGSGSDDMDDMEEINTMRHRRRQMYNDGSLMTDGPLPPPPPMLPFPPPSTSFYPMYRYQQQLYQYNNGRNLPMDPVPPPPFGQQPPYYPADDKEDKWDQRSIIPPPPPPIDHPSYDYGNRSSKSNMYQREEAMQNNNHLQKPWMATDPSLKLGLASKQSAFYGEPLQQQQQHAFYPPRHRRAHLYDPRNG